jgi:Asp-tRNA(Asn)/Glu-tRNA(Gln) amidotransferase A subunit family amidase
MGQVFDLPYFAQQAQRPAQPDITYRMMIPELPSIAKASHEMREGLLRPIDLVEHCLARMDELEGQVRAWVLIDPEGARREAQRLGKLQDDDDWLGPLHGIPIGIKDIIDVAGWPTKCGSPLREEHVAARDSAVVRSLKKAGAILLGKTVTTEWACFDPPPTRNPWNLNHTPGGSSSGSAAAVATDMCLAALGTQTGGSIIRPAAYCGVSGLKPGFGELPMEGIAPLTLHLDHVGPIARRVSDLYLVWQALAADAHGSMESMFSRRWADSDLESWIDAYGLNKSLFVLEGPLIDQATPEMQQLFQQVLQRLKSSLCLRSLQLPDSFRDVLTWHRRINVVEAAAYHRETFPSRRDQYGPCIASLLDEAQAVSAVDYAEALIRREEVRNELARLLHQHEDALGCLVMPATLGPAPGLDTTGVPTFNAPWSYIGWPSLTIPCGLSTDGLPVGLQFIAMTVPQVFAMAGLCERILGFHDRPTMLERAA